MILREEADARVAQFVALITGKTPQTYDVQLLDDWEYGWFLVYTLAGLPSPENELLGACPIFVAKEDGRVVETDQFEEFSDFKKAWRNGQKWKLDIQERSRREKGRESAILCLIGRILRF